MGNSQVVGGKKRPARSSVTEQALKEVSRQLVEDLWTVCANDRLYIDGAEAVRFLELLVRSVRVSMDRETMVQVVSRFGNQVSHEDLHNLLFLAQDELEEIEIPMSESLHRNFAHMVLPARALDLSSADKKERLHSVAGIETWRARLQGQDKDVILRCHALAYVRRDVDVNSVVDQMRRLHCQTALRYVGHMLDKDALVIAYEDPGAASLLSTILQSGRWNVDQAGVRKMFLRFAKGLLWLDKRKDFRHLQLRPDTVFVSEAGSKKMWCFVGEHLLKKRYDMVNVEMLGSVVAYCSPEMLSGDRFDTSAADVFSLGMLMYAALSGKEPFAGQEAAEVMEFLLAGRRPPLGGLGEMESIVAAAWHHDAEERVTMEELLEMLRRPLRSLRAGAGMTVSQHLRVPKRVSRMISDHKLSAAGGGGGAGGGGTNPAVAAGGLERPELTMSTPIVCSVPLVRVVPPLRNLPHSDAIAVPSGKPRSSSLSSSSYSVDDSVSHSASSPSAQEGSWTEAAAAESYSYNGGVMPPVKGQKQEDAPAGELWYSLILSHASRLQFRVYPVLTAFETRALQQHWARMWALRRNEGVVPFMGAVTRPFVAELWAMAVRLDLQWAASREASFLVELCLSMAVSLRCLHEQHTNTLGSLSLACFALENQSVPKAKLMLSPTAVKLSTQDSSAIPPEVLDGEPWSPKADVFALGCLIQRMAAANADMQLPKSRMFLKLLQHCVSEACNSDAQLRADAARVAQVIESAMR